MSILRPRRGDHRLAGLAGLGLTGLTGLVAGTVGLLLTVPVLAGVTPAARAADGAAAPDGGAVSAWTAGAADIAGPYVDKTVRDVVHTSIAGDDVQLRLSNAFGTVPVTFDAVWVGRQDSGAAVAAGTNRQALFGGSTSVTVPAGAEVLSDPVDMSVTAAENLSVSIHVAGDTGEVTGHWQAQQDGWYADGDTASQESPASFGSQVEWWFWLDAVVVRPQVHASTVVALGDSITEGYGSTTNANHRYPNYLATRLAPYRRYAVADEGIGGNRVVADGGSAGVSVQARLDRDVLSQPQVSTVIYLEGINDIDSGAVSSAAQLIQADKAIIARVHAAGLRILGGTLTPFEGSGGFSAAHEQIRSDLNDWIRTSGAFDGVVDFDAATRDPADPLRFLPAYDAGDHLHPNDAGYQAMADAVPLRDVVTPSVTRTALRVTPASVSTLAAATATVTVTSEDGIAPGGTVTVTVHGRRLTGTLGTDGAATVTLPRLGAGRYPVTAAYAGSDALAPSASTATLTVSRVTPAISASLSRAKVKRHRSTRLTVSVGTGAARADGGAVTVTVAGLRGTLTGTVHAGQVVIVVPGLAKAGRHTVSYRYGGDAALAPTSTRTLRLTVKK